MMKNNFVKVFLLAIVLMIISAIVILTMGSTLTTSYDVHREGGALELENASGEVELLDEKSIGNNYKVTIKAVKPGRVYLNLRIGNDYTEQRILYVHKTMIITDNSYFGYSRGSEVIPISLSILLIYILYLIVKRYKESVNENLYQYKNVAYLGMMIFVFGLVLSNALSIINYQGLYETIRRIISSMSYMSFFLLPIALITFILVTISNIRLIKKEGKSLKNLLGLFLGIFICLLTFLPDYLYSFLQRHQFVNIYNLNSAGPYIYDFIESLIYLTVAYLECILIGTIIVAIKSVKKKVAFNKDYIIVLGCQIKKDGTLTPLLKGRVDKAIEFRNKQLKETSKDLVFVLSGGKGADEIISEAEAMKNYLLQNRISEKNILVEDKSKNTLENIKFSNKLINNKDANIAFSTTNYHVFRAGLLAAEQGLKYEGMGSKTKVYFWVNAFIREFIGTLHSERKKHIIVFLSILLSLIPMILVTYFANNI